MFRIAGTSGWHCRVALAFVVVLSCAGSVAAQRSFIRGDASNDGRVSINDVLVGLYFLKLGGPGPRCMAAGDADGDSVIGLSDPLYLLGYLFSGGPPPPLPFPECGPDPDEVVRHPCDVEPVCDGSLPPLRGEYLLFVSTIADATAPEAEPVSIAGVAGDVVDVPFSVLADFPGSGLSELNGWSFGVEVAPATGVTLAGLTIDDTDSGSIIRMGFSVVEPVGSSGAVTVVVPSLIFPVELALDRPRSLLRGVLRVEVPERGEATYTVTPAGGLQGSGQPVALEFVVDEVPFMPDVAPLTVRVTSVDPSRAFIRGDTNQDGAYDIADAVATLGSLFLGGFLPPCADAADADDDGAVDISDAVFTLGCLFLGSTCPPAPHPRCGLDETPGGPGCEMGGGC